MYTNITFLLFCVAFIGCFRNEKTELADHAILNVDKHPVQIDTLQIIKFIENKYKEINTQKSLYDKVEKEIHDESTPDALLTVYYDKRTLKKIEAAYYSETGKTLMEYYYLGANCLYLHKRHFIYNKPIYMEGSKIESTREDKYYFYGKKLLKWEAGKKTMTIGSGEFMKANKSINTDLSRYEVLDLKRDIL